MPTVGPTDDSKPSDPKGHTRERESFCVAKIPIIVISLLTPLRWLSVLIHSTNKRIALLHINISYVSPFFLQEMYAWVAVFILPVNSAANPYLYTISTLERNREKSKGNPPTHSTWKSECTRELSVGDLEMVRFVRRDSGAPKGAVMSCHSCHPIYSRVCVSGIMVETLFNT